MYIHTPSSTTRQRGCIHNCTAGMAKTVLLGWGGGGGDDDSIPSLCTFTLLLIPQDRGAVYIIAQLASLTITVLLGGLCSIVMHIHTPDGDSKQSTRPVLLNTSIPHCIYVPSYAWQGRWRWWWEVQPDRRWSSLQQRKGRLEDKKLAPPM